MTDMTRELIIDDEFKNLISPLQRKEFILLEENLLTDGCITPIIVWNGIIVDGHNRYAICKKHDIPIMIKEITLDSRDEVIAWICKNQLGRRNISEETRKYLIGRQYECEKKIIKNPYGNNQYVVNQTHRDRERERHKTAMRIARENNIAPTTVQKYSAYSCALDKIQKKAPNVAEKILNGQCKVSHENIVQMAKMRDEELVRLNECISQNNNEFVEYSRGRQIMQKAFQVQPRGSIKDMPQYDPDAPVAELYLTIPTWISSINRTKKNADFGQISENAKLELKNALCKMNESINEILSILEAKNERI